MEMAALWNRFFLLEDARSIAQANYAKDPFDADNLTRWGSVLLQLSHYENAEDKKKMQNLTRWGSVLLQLSHYENAEDKKKMIKDAISKLEEALVFNPIRHDALWLLGNCFANQALMASDLNEIKGYKDKASACYQKALYADPGNENYIRSLELFAKAPEMEKDIHTNANMDKDTLTNGEMDKEIHTNAKMDKDVLSNGEMDKEIHTDAEIDKDTHTVVETKEDIHTNAFDQQYISDASSKAKISKKKGSDLKKYAIFGWIILAVGIVAWAGSAI